MRLRWLSVVAGLGLGLSSCSFDDGGVQPDGNGTPPDAAVDAVPPVCTPGCEGDILVTCPEGVAQRAECDLGCVADATPHCAVMVPSNGVSAGDLDVVPVDRPFVVPSGSTYTIDTDTGRIVDEESRQVRPATQGGGVHDGTGTFYSQRGARIGLFALDALTVEEGGVLRGEGDRALVILARGDILVRGTIDFSAGCSTGSPSNVCGGPGAGAGASTISTSAGGCAPGGNGAGSPSPDPEEGVESGGGGGGFGATGAAGGRGGTQGNPRPGGIGGVTTSCSGPSLVPLSGGSGGGAGGVGDVNGGAGGGGGGALQLSSFSRISIAPADGETPAILRASGAGGTGPVAGRQGGGGGGSGGAFLLEAPMIEVAGGSVVAANGGGGGSGTVASSNASANGAPGGISSARAAGGIGDPDENNQGFGGVGGARSGAAGAGGATIDGSGGGGGGVGIIRINRRTLTISGAVISPEPSEGALTVQ